MAEGKRLAPPPKPSLRPSVPPSIPDPSPPPPEDAESPETSLMAMQIISVGNAAEGPAEMAPAVEPAPLVEPAASDAPTPLTEGLPPVEPEPTPVTAPEVGSAPAETTAAPPAAELPNAAAPAPTTGPAEETVALPPALAAIPSILSKEEDDGPGLEVTGSSDAEELDELELAPDSEDQPNVAPDRPRPPPPRRPTGEMAAPLPPPSVQKASPAAAAPPPSPPEGEIAPSGKSLPKRRLRAPWWEALFAEDFSRAEARPKPEDVSREANFIQHQLALPDGAVVLDVGCGHGMYAVELARRGFGVVGLDLSLFQLAIAGEYAQEQGQKLNFLQGDMREMAFEETFDGLISWNTSFGYFEEDKNIAVADRMFHALKPGGMMLLDVINRDYVVANEPCQRWFSGDACVAMDDPSLDPITSRLRVKRSLILDDGRTREASFTVRLYSLHELGRLLHEVGFRICSVSGDPATPGAFFGCHSPRILIAAQRP